MEAITEKSPHAARNRQFYSLPADHQTSEHNLGDTESKEHLLEYIRENVIGRDKVFSGPFGLRKGDKYIIIYITR
jgi:hypothetical protein